MANSFTINTDPIDGLNFRLKQAKFNAQLRGKEYVKKLTEYAATKMRFYVVSQSKKTTGSLAKSISTRFGGTKKNIYGIAFVGETVKYGLATEYGIKSRRLLTGKPSLSFPLSSWKNGSSITRFLKYGRYVFSKVYRGTYRGKFFTKKAFKSLLIYRKTADSEYIRKVKDDIIGH